MPSRLWHHAPTLPVISVWCRVGPWRNPSKTCFDLVLRVGCERMRERVYSRDMGRGNSREGGGAESSRGCYRMRAQQHPGDPQPKRSLDCLQGALPLPAKAARPRARRGRPRDGRARAAPPHQQLRAGTFRPASPRGTRWAAASPRSAQHTPGGPSAHLGARSAEGAI